MNVYSFLHYLAEQLVREGEMFELIQNEQPIDSTSYAQSEAKCNLLWQLGRAYVDHYRLDPGTFEREVNFKRANKTS